MAISTNIDSVNISIYERLQMEKLAYRQYELVNVLPFSEAQIRKFIKSGELECVRYGRAVLVTIDAIRKFLNKERGTAAAQTE